MLKIIKEMKPFILIVLLIIGLLFFQARTDLALPEYMSEIVNVGIQQSGIENAIPQVIRASQLDKIKMFLSEDEIKLIDNSFKLINKDNLTEEEFNSNLKKYPLLASESLYILDTSIDEDIENMNSFLAKAMLKFNLRKIPAVIIKTNPFEINNDKIIYDICWIFKHNFNLAL